MFPRDTGGQARGNSPLPGGPDPRNKGRTLSDAEAGSAHCGTGGHPKRPGPGRLPKRGNQGTSPGSLHVGDPAYVQTKEVNHETQVGATLQGDGGGDWKEAVYPQCPRADGKDSSWDNRSVLISV